MFKRSLLVAAAALSFGAYGLLNLGDTAAQGPGPTAGELLADELMGSIGAGIGPDGALYVAEAGAGGDTVFESENGTLYNGFTGQVSRIDPETGAKTVAVDGIPSVGFSPDRSAGATGVIDVAFIGDTMYILLTGTGEAFGFAEYPIGIYEVEDDGDLTLVADIGGFNDDNMPSFPDATPGGNPFSFTPYGANAFIVTDGNFNRVLLAELDGDIEIVVAFDNVVPTGTAVDGDDVYITEIGSFPHTPEKGKILTVDVAAGTAEELSSGYANMIDVEFGEDGTLYALNMGDEQSGDGPPAVPFTGTIFIVEADGDLVPIVTGFMQATSLDIDGDTAFVTGLFGQVWKVEGLSDLDPLPTPTPETPTSTPTTTSTTVPPTATSTTVPPTSTATMVPPTATNTSVPPTATRTATRTATVRPPQPPNTGTGSDSSGGSANWLLLIGASALVAAGGATLVTARKKS